MPENMKDLIFEQFEVGCLECRRRTSVEFEVLRLNQKIICTHCGNKFLANKDADMLLEMIKMCESPEAQVIPIKYD